MTYKRRLALLPDQMLLRYDFVVALMSSLKRRLQKYMSKSYSVKDQQVILEVAK